MRRYFIGRGPKVGKRRAGSGGPARTGGAAPPQAEAHPTAASRGFEALGDFLLRNRAALDAAPIGLGDIDGGGALAGPAAAIEDEIDAAIHHTENVDAAIGASSRAARL